MAQPEYLRQKKYVLKLERTCLVGDCQDSSRYFECCRISRRSNMTFFLEEEGNGSATQIYLCVQIFTRSSSSCERRYHLSLCNKAHTLRFLDMPGP